MPERETILHYDEDDPAYDGRGLLTTKIAVEDFATGAGPTTTFEYDIWGNLRELSDPNVNAGVSTTTGPTQTIEYDGVFHAFPTLVTNALGHRAETLYDVAAWCAQTYGYAAQPGFGLPAEALDENDIVAARPGTQSCYDPFGRLLETRVLDGAEFAARQIWTYADLGDPGIGQADIGATRQTLTSAPGEPLTYRSLQMFVDPFGRVREVRHDGPANGAGGPQQVVQCQAYDTAGRVKWVTDPVFSAGAPCSGSDRRAL